MRKAAQLVRERADTIADSITLEQGKPRAQAKIDAIRARDIIESDAEEGRRALGAALTYQGNILRK